MKLAARLLLFTLTLFAVAALPRPARAEWGRTYLSGAPVQPLPKDTAAQGGTPASDVVVPINQSGSWWLCPSVGFDVFQVDLKTRQYVTGIVPGIGYGIKYKPAGWTATAAVVALDVFVQASLVDNSATTPGATYFSIEALPILTIMDWVSFGFGMDEYIGVSSLPSELHWVFSFGMKKST